MQGRSFSIQGRYRYGFNGKELEEELIESGGCISFEARIYISGLGKFMSVDPKTYEYPWQTPYAYYKNSPVSILDLKGMGGPFQDVENEYKEFEKNNTTKRKPDEDWFNNPPYSLRRKMRKYTKRSNQLRQQNPMQQGQNIQTYENNIVMQMLQLYGDKKWMWWKRTNKDELTGQPAFVFVGGLVIPTNNQVNTIQIFPNVQGGGVNGGGWNLGNNLGNVSMTITNPSLINIVTVNVTLNGIVVVNNQNINTNNNVTFNFTITQANSTLFVNWFNIDLALNFSFNVTNTTRTFPVIIPQIDMTLPFNEAYQSRELRRRLVQGENIFRM